MPKPFMTQLRRLAIVAVSFLFLNDALAQTTCKVTLNSCPAYPQYNGETVSDTYNGAATNQTECMQRASDYYSWCQITNPATTVTSAFYSGNSVVQSVTVPANSGTSQASNTSCKVTLSSCPAYPQDNATTISDTYNGAATNQAECIQRATDYYSWCQITNPATTVTSAFYSGNSVLQSITVPATSGTSQAPNNNSQLSNTSCKVTLSSCPAYPQDNATTISDTYNGAATNQAECMQRASDYYSWCQITNPATTVTSAFYSGNSVVQAITVPTSPSTPSQSPQPGPSTAGCFQSVQVPPFQTSANALGDEFVGPFASWANLKTNFGAFGDGVHDDTKAIQAALTAISKASNSPVLYIPVGTYLVTQTVAIQSATGVSVIGADPSTTTLKWAGANGGILLHIDGVAYSRFDRLTFEGSGAASVLVDQSLTSQGQYFDTGNEYADDVFQNASIGIQGGQYGLGASESSVLRTKFLNNSSFGIILRNFNALDWWVWYSDFENNQYAISNNPGAGNFQAYNNIFKGSTQADLEILNTGNFNIRDNFSIGSNKFLNEEFYYTNAAVTRLQSNTVITPSGNNCQGCSMMQGNMGPTVLTDNTFISPPDATWSAVIMNALNSPDCALVGNTFTTNNFLSCQNSQTWTNGRVLELNNQVVSASSINQTPPTLPGVLPNYNRTVFDVPAGSNSATIQAAIQQAAAFCGQRPVVHLSYGSYSLAQTLTIPANCNIQLVGDGHQTALNWAGSGSGPVLLLQGPSQAILRDFYVNAGTVEGIDVQNADQQGSRIYMEQPQVLRSTVADVLVDSLDYTNVELDDFDLAYTAIAPAKTGVALKVVGGPQAASGAPQYGRTNLFAGSLADNYVAFQVSQGGTLLVRDAWSEATSQSIYAQISDNSTFTVEGSRIALPSNNGDAMQINNLACNATIMSSAPDSDVNIGNGTGGNVWILGNNFGSVATSFLTVGGEGVTSAFNLNRNNPGNTGSIAIPDITALPTSAFIDLTLAQSRSAHPDQITDLVSGVTDTRFYRISVELGTIGVHLER